MLTLFAEGRLRCCVRPSCRGAVRVFHTLTASEAWAPVLVKWLAAMAERASGQKCFERLVLSCVHSDVDVSNYGVETMMRLVVLHGPTLFRASETLVEILMVGLRSMLSFRNLAPSTVRASCAGVFNTSQDSNSGAGMRNTRRGDDTSSRPVGVGREGREGGDPAPPWAVQKPRVPAQRSGCRACAKHWMALALVLTNDLLMVKLLYQHKQSTVSSHQKSRPCPDRAMNACSELGTRTHVMCAASSGSDARALLPIGRRGTRRSDAGRVCCAHDFPPCRSACSPQPCRGLAGWSWCASAWSTRPPPPKRCLPPQLAPFASLSPTTARAPLLRE